VNKGRPTPPLPNLNTHHKTKTEQHTRHFCIPQNEKVHWQQKVKQQTYEACSKSIRRNFFPAKGWILVEQASYFPVGPVYVCFNKHEVWNKQSFSDLNHL
jgi:hypothetical protein